MRDKQNIIVIKSDKGNNTIILNRNEYERAMEKLVNDESVYKKTSRNPTNRVQKSVNEMVTKWRLNNRITDDEEEYLKTRNSIAPAIYGLGKLHKRVQGELLPMRPVVSTIQSPTYKISKMIAKCLSKAIPTSDFQVRDSWDFAKVIQNVKVPENYIIVSLDATSLFTNIQQDMCIDAINKRWNRIKDHTFLTREEFIEAVKLITSQSYFRYQDQYYLQVSGLAMGNSISGLLADMVMNDLENHTLRKLPFIVPFYKRYVDDIIAVIPATETQNILDHFNKYDNVHKKLKFTMEIENNKSINFLDFTLKRDNSGNIWTKWYQKDIASGRYLNFESCNPTTHKRNVVTAMTDRAITFTHPKDREESLNKVRGLLNENGYPNEFVQDIITKRVDRFYNGKTTEEKPKVRRIASPYVPGLTERINKVLQGHQMNLASKSSNNIGNLYTRVKYTIPKNEKSKIVYEVKCLCGKKYVGNTKQLAKTRFSKHRSDCNLKKTKETTGLTMHSVRENHNFDFDRFTILDHVPSYFQRQIAEKMHIAKTPNNVNLTIDTAGLHQSYADFSKSTARQKDPRHQPTSKVLTPKGQCEDNISSIRRRNVKCPSKMVNKL